jgi:hypothetical protein
MAMKKAVKKSANAKSSRLKLERAHPSHGQLVEIPPPWQKKLGTGMMLIPGPLKEDAIMHKVSRGRLITSGQIRKRLAREANADCACPLTTGIFVRIAAEAAEEDRLAGKVRITPYWRTIKDDGSLFKKFPGGVKSQAARLREEGFAIEPAKDKKLPRVRDFADHLVRT